MNNILLYSNIKNQHVKHVKMGLDALKPKNLKINTEKCRFHVQKITFLKFIIIPRNIQIETTKIDNIEIWPASKNMKDLQKLLGFMGIFKT